MDKKYITLFKNLAQTTATTAETVMDYDKQKDDAKGLETATSMRDDYQTLADKIDDNYEMDKVDAARLLISSMIVVNQLNSKIESMKAAMTGYQTDVIPKLKDIVDNAKDDKEAKTMANEKFIIEDNN